MNTHWAGTISDLFTREEITELTAKSDLHGSWAVLSTWAVMVEPLPLLLVFWEYLPKLGQELLMYGSPGYFGWSSIGAGDPYA